MIRAGFTFEHPAAKTRTVVLESDAETNGMGWLLEATRAAKLGSDLRENLHQTWTETFEIIKGAAKYKLDGIERIAEAGGVFVVERRHFHAHPWNAADEELAYRQRDRFARSSPDAVRDILGIFATRAGRVRDRIRFKKGSAKLFPETAAIRTAIQHENYMQVHPCLCGKRSARAGIAR